MIGRLFLFVSCLTIGLQTKAQQSLDGTIVSNNEAIPFAKIKIKGELEQTTLADENGAFIFKDLRGSSFMLTVRSIGYHTLDTLVTAPFGTITIELTKIQEIEEMVVTGTLKEISKKESTVNVEVYTPKFFQKNPVNSVYESVQNINGVRPQLNCNICSTGDIHINGLEGPYTMVLIDGMPIVSSLSTVYGLSGIPSSMIERMEIVKGPASSLYGSEAIGGVINIITKSNETSTRYSI